MFVYEWVVCTLEERSRQLHAMDQWVPLRSCCPGTTRDLLTVSDRYRDTLIRGIHYTRPTCQRDASALYVVFGWSNV